MNPNEKEGTTNEISLSLNLINMKDGNNFYVGVSKPQLFVLVCSVVCLQRCLFLAMQLYWNFKLYCFYFFHNLRFQIGGVAYLRMRLIHGRLRYFFLQISLRQETEKYGFKKFQEKTLNRQMVTKFVINTLKVVRRLI